ncbi:hypothetical protein Q4561_10280 [Alteromonas sp. 1_MG-2023]|uniref:hypothetical protein n=1 Tax=Alteromonas sp. 1_MG-2023 TaxID=3062669 RepID=UPI0026E24C53|nr:hypothetical protein [Alteromonas sp. 1_MG-2023]MDO6567443.1 hypothetical protein [Alteromonas sp. 1_MG-2023]
MIKKITLTLATLVFALNTNAALIFQGSSSPTSTVTMTVAEARAAWEAELFSFDNDDLTGLANNNNGGLTSAFGNIFTSTGNGSSISVSGSSLYGSRGSASLIAFDVVFPSAVNAIGFDVNDNDGGGMTMWLTESDGTETQFDLFSTPGSNVDEFFGIVFSPTTLITQLRVGGTDPGGITTWDNFTTGIGQEAQQVISASSPGTLLISLFSLVFLATRKKIKC